MTRQEGLKFVAAVLLLGWLCWLAPASLRELWKGRSRIDRTQARVELWEELIRNRLPVEGYANAPVVIIEFSDYECPFCALEETRLKSLVQRHQKEVALYRFEFPQEALHASAMRASIAAECAREGGFPSAYSSALFAHQREFRNLDWAELAMTSGAGNVEQFRQCMKGEDARRNVESDLSVGRKLHVSGTPTLLVNGERFSGALSSDALEKIFVDRRNKVSGAGDVR